MYDRAWDTCQLRNVYANIGAWHLNLWLHAFVEWWAWDEPDEQEQRVIDGCPSMRPWPDHLRAWHAHRRWGEARSGSSTAANWAIEWAAAARIA